jgi:hypothetical protein
MSELMILGVPPHRTKHPTSLIWTSLAASLSILAATSRARADDPPLMLSNEHIGMTSVQIQSTQSIDAHDAPFAPAGLDPIDTHPSDASFPAWGSEFVSNENPGPVGCMYSPGGSPGRAIGSFGQCIEASIRGGVSYDAASPVCRTLFPGQG